MNDRGISRDYSRSDRAARRDRTGSDCVGSDQGCQPIPVELHSVYESGPFTRCTICNCQLYARRDEGAGRLIVGSTQECPPREGETACRDVCENTGGNTGDTGDDSNADGTIYEIQKVFRGPEVMFEMAICRRCGEQVAREFSEESIEAMKGFLLSNFRPDDEASRCHFCALPRTLLDSWTIVGACRNNVLIFPPIILCEPCSENLQQRLSRKTREVQDEFVRDHFPGVPADMDFSPSVFGV